MLLYVAIAAGLLALYLFALIDAVRIPSPVWAATGRSKSAWVLALAFGVFAASVVYLLMVRGSLRAEQANPATVPARPPADLGGGIVRCGSCGFNSNPAGALSCRNCGERLAPNAPGQ